MVEPRGKPKDDRDLLSARLFDITTALLTLQGMRLGDCLDAHRRGEFAVSDELVKTCDALSEGLDSLLDGLGCLYSLERTER